jgi:hypothetical protein
MYQASASRANNIVSSVPKPLSSSCRDRWVSDFPDFPTSNIYTSPWAQTRHTSSKVSNERTYVDS